MSETDVVMTPSPETPQTLASHVPRGSRGPAGPPTGGREQTWQPVMRSPINALHEKLGAELAVTDGWEIPRRYRNADQERSAIQEGLAIADITARGKIDVRGALNAALASLPGTRGATLARISREWALVLTPASKLPSTLELITRAADPKAMVTDATSIYAGMALLGPRVDDALRRLITVDPSTLLAGECMATQLLRMPAILLRRALPVGVVEIYLPSELARYAWEALFEVTHPLDPQPVGWDALQAEGWR